MRPNTAFPRVTAVLVAVAVASIVATSASARSTAKPTLVATPALSGQVTNPFVGDKLTTNNGQWSGSPTSYTYVWQRCDADRRPSELRADHRCDGPVVHAGDG